MALVSYGKQSSLALLKKYFDEDVHISGLDNFRVSHFINEDVPSILAICHKLDIRIAIKPIGVGSYFGHLKVHRPDEFDIMIPFSLIDLCWTTRKAPRCTFRLRSTEGKYVMQDTTSLRGSLDNYELCDTGKILPAADPGYVTIIDAESPFSYQGVIPPFLVKRYFRKILLRALQSFNSAEGSCAIEQEVHGPTNTLVCKCNIPSALNFGNVHIDFTPCVKVKEFSPNTSWPTAATRRWLSPAKIQRIKSKGVALVPKMNYHWFVSYAEGERDIVEDIDNDGGCRKKCHRIMKALNEDCWFITVPHRKTPLSTYHLKNVWLAQCEAQPEPYRWTCDKLEARMMDILDELETCMRNKRLPMYFDNAVNLLQTADCEELHQLEEKILDFRVNERQALINAIRKHAEAA